MDNSVAGDGAGSIHYELWFDPDIQDMPVDGLAEKGGEKGIWQVPLKLIAGLIARKLSHGEALVNDDPFVCEEAGFAIGIAASESELESAIEAVRKAIPAGVLDELFHKGWDLLGPWVWPGASDIVLQALKAVKYKASPRISTDIGLSDAHTELCGYPSVEEILKHHNPDKVPNDWGQLQVAGTEYRTALGHMPEAPIVAILDTGMRFDFELMNPALDWVRAGLDNGQFKDGWRLVLNGDGDPNGEPGDTHGHGSQLGWLISGMAPQTVANGSGIVPGCPLLPIVIADSVNSSAACLAAGICVALRWGAKILVNTYATPEYSEALDRAIRLLQRKKALLVTAAGNCAHEVSLYPGRYGEEIENVISVGACYFDKKPTWFSHSGTYRTFLAPGYDVNVPAVGSQPSTGEPVKTDPEFMKLEGTSYATPLVAGAILRRHLLEQDPGPYPYDTYMKFLHKGFKTTAPEDIPPFTWPGQEQFEGSPVESSATPGKG